MFNHPTIFFAALFAGLLGFGGITGPAVGIAQVLFVVLVVAFVALLFIERTRKAPNPRLQAWRQTRWTRERSP